MGLISDKIDKIKYSLECLELAEPDDVAIKKGKDFEKTAFLLFPQYDFDCFDKNRDEFDPDYQGSFRKNQSPFDFGFECRRTHQRFYVECKYRSQFFQKGDHNVLYVTKDRKQFDSYKEKAAKLGLKVFLVVGVGGTPKKPKTIYCLPLDALKYHTVYDYVCDRYVHQNDKMFVWRNGLLL